MTSFSSAIIFFSLPFTAFLKHMCSVQKSVLFCTLRVQKRTMWRQWVRPLLSKKDHVETMSSTLLRVSTCFRLEHVVKSGGQKEHVVKSGGWAEIAHTQQTTKQTGSRHGIRWETQTAAEWLSYTANNPTHP
jgi:hypothetical protein